MTIIGISSSPIVDGNTDRMIKSILEKGRKPSEFINLTQLSYSPCRACAHLCAGDNLCKLDDDLKLLYPKFLEAEALILGSPSYFNNMNGYMMGFLERLWAFRHQRFPLEGNPYVAVASGGVRSPEQVIEAVKNRMTAYGASFLGSVAFTSTIIPCLKCGYGNVCEIGAAQMLYGEEGRKNLKVTKEHFKRWEDNPEIKSQIDAIGREIAAL